MNRIDQTIVDSKKGNCFQAALATLFGRELENTINVVEYVDTERGWGDAFVDWVESIGYEYYQFLSTKDSDKETYDAIYDSYKVNGLLLASVKSKNYEGGTHAVLINSDGDVLHDPSPDKKWQGLNVVEEQELKGWYVFTPAAS